MAATSQISGGGRIVTTICKRFFFIQRKQQIWNKTSTASLNCNRGIHNSVYDKNLDDQLRPSVVPDAVIVPQSEKYWAPHPRTGVFGPAATTTEQPADATGEHKVDDGESGTVLEQQAWFRPLEDVEKPRQN